MEFEEERNRKPKTTGNNTPAVVLAILFGIVVLLLYAGWNLMSDDASNITDMKSVEKAVTPTDSDVIETSTPIAEEREEIIEEPETTPPPAPVEKKPEPAAVKSAYKGETAVHIVKEGETFYGIANKFNTSSDNLKALNPDINPGGIKVGITRVKVPVQAVHTVGPGDILRVVANKYGISVDALMTANGKKKNHAQRGEKLLIPHKKKV